MFEPEKLRVVMKWSVTLKDTEFEGGKIIIKNERRIQIPVKYLEINHMVNIGRLLKNKPRVWNEFTNEEWLRMLKWELEYRKKMTDAFVKEIMKLKFNVISDLFNAYPELAFSH